MIDFHSLTPIGKTRRLRALAREALALYGIGDARLTLLKYSWNTIFRVDAPDDRRYVLRLSRPGVRDLLSIHSELTWIDALARDTDIIVPRPVHTRAGGLVSQVGLPSVPEPRYVALFHWVGGRHAMGKPSERVITLLGETMARLHDHAETFAPSEPFTRARFDRIGTFTDTSQIHTTTPHALIAGERLDLFRREAQRVQAELDRLFAGSAPPRFLHLDMHLGNVKVQGDRLAVLDFDDSMWAYPVQDVAISLYYLRYARGFTEESREWLRRGYCRIREWPEEWEGQVDLLIEARALDMVDVLLSLDHPAITRRLPQLLQSIEDQIRHLASPTPSRYA